MVQLLWKWKDVLLKDAGRRGLFSSPVSAEGVRVINSELCTLGNIGHLKLKQG